MGPRIRTAMVLALAIAGIVVAASLLERSFALRSGAADQIGVCSTLFGGNCDDALRRAAKWELGIPLAGWGLVYFGWIGAACVLALALGERFRRTALLGVVVVATAGVGVGVLLSIDIARSDGPACPLCLLAHAVSLLIGLAAWFALRGGERGILADLGRGAAWLMGRTAPAGGEAREAPWRALGLATCTLVAALVYQWVWVEGELRGHEATAPVDPERLIAEYEATPVQDLEVGEADPHLGPLDAPARLVVFSDLRCPGCRKIMPLLQKMVAVLPGKVCVVYKHFPLEQACNAAVRGALHPGACEAARAAQAAHAVGGFWRLHDRILAASGRPDAAALREVAQDAGLDVEAWERALAAPETAAKVAADIQLGIRVGVRATPNVHLNGHRIAHVSGRALGVLVRHVLDEAVR